MAPRLLSALLLAALLAGCASAPKPGAPGSTSGPGSAAVATPGAPFANGTLPKPEWSVRDWWTYKVGNAKATYVVTADLGTDWMVDTDSAERAFQNARDDVSRLGPQRKSDLAGSQGDDRVQFFQWPLADGKAWDTTWDHQPVHVVAHVRGAVADLEATDRNGTRVYGYTYDAAVGWFRSLRHYAPDGELLIALDLDASGHGWTGTVVRYTLRTLYAATGANGGADVKQLQPDAGATDLWLDYHLRCTAGGGYSLALNPTQPTTISQGFLGDGACSPRVDLTANVTGPLGSQWLLAYSWGSGPPMDYTVEVVQRTREDIPVG